MLKEYNAKKEHFKKQYQQLKASNSLTFFRFYIFITSTKGQKQTLNFAYKVIRYIFRKLIGYKPKFKNDYEFWRHLNRLKANDIKNIKGNIANFAFLPKISIVMPTYNSDTVYLENAIQSVINQLYPNWELCIADDNSTQIEVKNTLKKFAESNNNIKVMFRTENGHISACTNSAINLATGDYIAFLDHDDQISEDALYEIVFALNKNINYEIIYSDEDKINEQGEHVDPYFKPDWCPDSFLARNYINHFTVIKKSLIKKVGGLREGFEGAQDFDLLLRTTEIAKDIYHIPKVLYHWRMHQNSTSSNNDAKPYVSEAGVKALEETLIRRNLKGEIIADENSLGFYTINHSIINNQNDKVSIIIPTKNKHELCEVAIKSIFDLSTYKNFEIILVNNNSNEPAFFNWVKTWEQKEPLKFKCIDDNGSFNFSRLMNSASKIATGKYLLLLNNDVEVIEPDFMKNMISYCQFERIGAVGSKLIYPNNTIQHAGVIIGLGGIAGHTFVGLDKNERGYFNYLKCVNNYSALTAACLMVRKNVYDEVNGFEESLAVEFNDIDFCLKLKDAGYDNVYLPNVQLYHYESISRGHPHRDRKSYKQHLNDLKFFEKKWKKYIDHDPCYNPHLTKIYTDFRLNIKD